MAEPSILGALRDPQFRSDTLRNLVEALNGAKRSLTVGSLGAVGDMGNTLANLVRAGAGTAYHETTGRPIPQALEYRDPARDFGTSASLGNFAERQGWLPPQTGSIPETAGALLGPIVAMKAPDLAQSTLRGLVSALKSEPSRRMVEGYMGGMGMKPQAIVWHGSPHQFDAFDSSKIGTGEGAQAYGHGLYLAETPDVATRYRDTLTNFRPDHIEAKLIEAGISPEFANTYSQFSAQTKGGARGFDDFAELMSKPGPSPYIEQFRQRIRAEMPAARTAGDAIAGSLYKVDLPDPLIARMLDWDKPLSQQPKNAQSFFSGLSRAPEESQTIGEWLRPRMDEGMAPYWSDDLRKAGIPGIRYLDGGSRADGAGTSNFVVFPGEESALTILERNGKPVRNNHAPITPDAVMEAKFKPTMQQRLETAQVNAESMLGLPKNNTAIDRAKTLGAQPISGIPLEMINAPSKYLDDAYELGMKAKQINPDINKWARGAYEKELGAFPWEMERGPAWEAFFETGNRGYEKPPVATGYRYGDLPDKGRSWNHRDNIPEYGVSMAEVDHPSANSWSDPVSKMFIEAQGRPRVDVGGYLHPIRTGSDGEPLLVGAGKLKGDFKISSGKERSRFAAFDPARRNESDLLASFAGAGILSPLVLEQLAEPRDKKDKPRK